MKLSAKESALQRAIVAYVLSMASESEGPDPDSLGVAVDLLRSGFGIEGTVPPSNQILTDYTGGGSATDNGAGSAVGGAAAAAAAAAASTPSSSSSSSEEAEWDSKTEQLFQKFVKKIASTGFFKGHEPGSEEYEYRYARAKSKFKEKMAAKRGKSAAKDSTASTASTAEEEVVPRRTPEEDKAAIDSANVCKGEANAMLKKKNYIGALRLYDRAISLLPVSPATSSEKVRES